MKSGKCAVADCSNNIRTGCYCGKHYSRWLRHGDPLKTTRTNTITHRNCTHCKKCLELNRNNFTYDASCTHGFRYSCRNCDKIHLYPKRKETHMIKTYGINYDGYQKILGEQDGKCAICNSRTLLVMDHDHYKSENKMRGLLCNNCNRALGLFLDSPDILLKAFHYIRKHKGDYE